MTSTTHVLGKVHPAPAAPVAETALSASAVDRRVFVRTLLAAGLLFAVLQNPYWVPGGDSEVYIAIAQNLVQGNGLLWNGRPVGMVPPGWPLALAGVMTIVPTFLALKLVALASMLGALAVFYWICRRFASPALSAGVVLLTAILSHVYSLTFWLHSDALFCFVSALSLLLALQISEGRDHWWRIAAMLLCCALAVFVRWAGLLNVLLIGAVLLRGQSIPRLHRGWILTGAVALVIALTYVGTKAGMRKFAPPRVEFAGLIANVDASAVMEDAAASVSDANAVEGDYALLTGTVGTGGGGYAARIAGWGTWLAFLLWQPLRLGTNASWPAVWYVADLLGWLMLGMLIAAAVRDARAKNWLLLAVVIYSFGLCINWPNATARYLVPITPLILLGIIRGAHWCHDSLSKLWQRRAFHVAWASCLASIVLVNASLYAVDLSVMRSGDFYDRYEAGMTRSLLAVAQLLNQQQLQHGQAVVNPLYINLGRPRLSPTGLRALTMLTGKALLTVPAEFRRVPPKEHAFRDWFSRNNVRFYLVQPPLSPWRLWHFRVPWLQEWKTGAPASAIGGGWEVYRCDGRSRPVPLKVDQNVTYPTRVPGL